MTFMVAFIILTRCIIVQGNLEWKVFKKITEYGQDLTLICNVPNCCPKNAGWDKYTPQQRTIIIDVKTWVPTTKYDGNILTDGYTLEIRNLTKQDVNISYASVYGSSLGDQQYLLEENVFDYISTTHQHNPIDSRTFSAGDISTTQQNGQIGNQTFSSGTIFSAGIIIGFLPAAVAILFMICIRKRRKERHSNIRHSNSIEDSNEDVPLIRRCFKLDTDMISSLELTRPRLMNTGYWHKFTRFVLSEGWMDKEFQDIPEIGTKYGKKLRLHLKDFCSVPQLFDMFRYWWMNGVPYKFFDLLYWASNAINNNGNMHFTRANEAFRQKALMCLPCSIPNDVTVEDSAPMLAEE